YRQNVRAPALKVLSGGSAGRSVSPIPEARSRDGRMDRGRPLDPFGPPTEASAPSSTNRILCCRAAFAAFRKNQATRRQNRQPKSRKTAQVPNPSQKSSLRGRVLFEHVYR